MFGNQTTAFKTIIIMLLLKATIL